MRFLFMFILLFSTLSVSANPKIKLVKPSVDFGTILPNSKHNHTFTIKNDGTSDLIISEVKPACGCTIANLSNKTIKPGTTATLAIELKAPQKDSKIKKFISLSSNDISKPVAKLTIVAEIKSKYKISKESFQLKSILTGTKKTFSFTVTPVRGIPFTPHRMVFNKTFFTVNYKKLDKNNPLSSFQFDVTYDATSKFPPRLIKDSIYIYPREKDDKEAITIKVYGTVDGLINLSEKRFVDDLKRGEKSTRKIRLEHLNKEPFKISKIDSSNPMVTTEIIEIKNHKYDLLIKMKEGAKKRTEHVTLQIHTDNKQQKIIRIIGTYKFQPN